MFRKLSLAVILMGSVVSGYSQLEPEKKKIGRPDIPGTFMIEFGFNRLSRYPQDLQIGFWGSRT